VTLDEALAELGVDRGATADEARRAYMRLLKTRKPETDPEGFRRAREAYELAKEALEAVAAGRPPPTPVEAPLAAVPTAPRSVHPPAPAPAPRSPSAAPADIPAPAEIRHLLEQRQMQRAARGLTRIYEAAARSAHVATPPIALTLEVLLTLHEGGHFPTAEPLRLATQRWLEASGGEAKQLAGQWGAQSKIVGELAKCGGELSDEIRVAIARLALGERWVYGVARLQAHREADRAVAERDAAILAAHPNLPTSQAFVAVLRGDETAPPPVIERSGVPSLRVLYFAFVGAALAAGGIASSWNSRHSTQPPMAVVVPPTPTTTGGPKPSLAAAMSLAGAIAIEAHREQAAAPVQDRAAALHLALDQGDCAAATAAMDDMRPALKVDGSATPRLSANIDDLDQKVTEACRPDVSAANQGPRR
jgi:hypothetical protein